MTRYQEWFPPPLQFFTTRFLFILKLFRALFVLQHWWLYKGLPSERCSHSEQLITQTLTLSLTSALMWQGCRGRMLTTPTLPFLVLSHLRHWIDSASAEVFPPNSHVLVLKIMFQTSHLVGKVPQEVVWTGCKCKRCLCSQQGTLSNDSCCFRSPAEPIYQTSHRLKKSRCQHLPQWQTQVSFERGNAFSGILLTLYFLCLMKKVMSRKYI